MPRIETQFNATLSKLSAKTKKGSEMMDVGFEVDLGNPELKRLLAFYGEEVNVKITIDDPQYDMFGDVAPDIDEDEAVTQEDVLASPEDGV